MLPGRKGCSVTAAGLVIVLLFTSLTSLPLMAALLIDGKPDTAPRAPGKISSRIVKSNRAVSAGNTPLVVVAIDAGHGGQDPGAIGKNGLREKNLTLNIARQLYTLLKRDPLFKPVLTRHGDYFISVAARSDIARQQGATVLVSIHADAAPNVRAAGVSVWVLSNHRANNEMGNWLERHEKQSELLGGVGQMLASTSADPYLSQAVLDLQFGHSQRVGYEIALNVLSELRRVGTVHKLRPEHASLGVLRSPDIPSLLVETGFISNRSEERLLGTREHQDKLVRAIHKGLHKYFLVYPPQAAPGSNRRAQPPLSVASRLPLTAENSVAKSVVAKSVVAKSAVAKSAVAKSAVPSGILAQPGPVVHAGSMPRKLAAEKSTVVRKYHVKRGDTLSAIASRYGVSITAIQRINKIHSDRVEIGQTLAIP